MMFTLTIIFKYDNHDILWIVQITMFLIQNNDIGVGDGDIDILITKIIIMMIMMIIITI